MLDRLFGKRAKRERGVEDEPGVRDDLTHEVTVFRWNYGIRAWAESLYVPMVVGDAFVEPGPPMTCFGYDEIDRSAVHASELNVILVPEDYVVDYAEDGRLMLWDGDDNPCTVRCDDMTTTKFTVSSPAGEFETRSIPRYRITATTLDEDGGRYSIPMSVLRDIDHGGYFIGTRKYNPYYQPPCQEREDRPVRRRKGPESENAAHPRGKAR